MLTGSTAQQERFMSAVEYLTQVHKLRPHSATRKIRNRETFLFE